MLGAIYIGMSGMDAYEQGLQTISNNVANLNTAGFKAAVVSFDDLFSYGADPGLAYGTTRQLTGEGVRFGTSTTDFSQGDLQQSGNDLDLAIQGDGFFVLEDGGQRYYARTGQFVLDDAGYVVLQGTSHRLVVLDADGQPEVLSVGDKRTSAPQATTQVTFAGNLSSSATAASVAAINVYDGAGDKHVWTVAFARNAADPTPGNWTVTVTDAEGKAVGTSTLRFVGSVVDPSTSKLVISFTPAGSSTAQDVTLDFSGDVTSYSAGTESTLRAASVDGHAAGTLTGLTVDTDGQAKLTYSNGETELEGAVALASFRDQQQLEHIGDGLYRSPGLGPDRLLASGADGVGRIQSRQLEASNVDLSREFGQLILIQRGYQASSQVISVSNDMIQQLFGIRGQS